MQDINAIKPAEEVQGFFTTKTQCVQIFSHTHRWTDNYITSHKSLWMHFGTESERSRGVLVSWPVWIPPYSARPLLRVHH